MKSGTIILLVLLLMSFSLQAAAQSEQESGQMELQQLQAQMDAMLEEVNELQSYRTCAEQGKIFKPNNRQHADEDGCVTANALSSSAKKGENQKQNRAEASSQNALTPKNAGNNEAIAPTAKTFRLPSAAELTRDVPLAKLGQGETQGMGSAQPRRFNTQSAQTAPVNKQLEARSQSNSPSRSKGGHNEGGENFLGDIPAKYPNQRVKNLIEAAVDKALTGQTPDLKARQGDDSQGDDKTIRQSQKSLGQKSLGQQALEKSSEPTSSKKQAERTAQQQSNQPDYHQAHKEAVQNLVPNCREGEFLTTVDGKVMCQRAASAGKMACPPSTLRVYIGRLKRHMHYSVDYTPHGQEQQATQRNHKITVSCQNSDYRLKTVTRYECGGRQCHPSKKPAYSQTFYCHQDNTGRCYAKQNGRLVNHSFMEASITKQY